MKKIFIENYKNFDFSNLKDCIVVSSFLPCDVISKLRKNGCIYVKANSLDEIDGIEIKLNTEKKIKRGVGCSGKFI